MEFRQLAPQEKVLKSGQKTIGHILVCGHPSRKGTASDDAGPQDHVINTEGDHAGHGRNQLRGVLIVRMDHHHDIRPVLQRLLITGFLVPTVSQVPFMPECLDPKVPCQRNGPVGAPVIHQQHAVHHIHGDFPVGVHQGFFRVVGRKYHHYFFFIDHGDASRYGLSTRPGRAA